MKVWRSLNGLKEIKNAVLTIGTYDGVHIGHQSILKRVNDLAANVDGSSVLITFHPHPRVVINTGHSVSLLSPMDEKIDLLAQYGLQNLVIVPFTRAFSQMDPRAYVEDFLVKNFALDTVVIGYNHKFGKNRAGDFDFLVEQSKQFNFKVEQISKLELESISVSSTKVRAALSDGQVKHATSLLGHEYFLRGVVVKGQQLGKKMGFPTANLLIQSKQKLIPRNGVYAVRVRLNDQFYNGMLNIGFRPTVSGEDKTIEVNIFDFDQDIYGEKLELSFVDFLREEERFDSLDELKSQLEADRLEVKRILS